MKKYILIAIVFISLAFKADKSKSTYTIPLAAYSVTAGDIDMDGDNDIIVGHNYCSQTQWSGVSIMLNDGNGNFSLFDSVFLYNGQPNILLENLNTNLNKEIVAYYYNTQEENNYLAIINDFDLFDISYFSLYTDEGLDNKTVGDIDGDGNKDIVLSSNSGQFWGVLYNDGQGNFTPPEYHDVLDYFPSAMACGDLNNDGRDDLVVCGQSTEVFFSYENGFETLTLETNNFKEHAVIIDFDLDTDNDIVTFVSVAGITSIIIYENKGSNIMERLDEIYFPPMSSHYFICDFNNDSFPDILFQLLDQSGYNIYYNLGDFQLGNPQFVSLPPANPEEGWRNCYCADMDGNGFNDIITIKTLCIPLADNLEILFNDGNGNFGENPVVINESMVLKQQNNLVCYPNPFLYEIVFEFVIDEPSQVELSIYNVQGKLIKSIKQKIWEGGKNTIKWNGLNEYGKDCISGHYLFSMIINGEKQQSIKFTKLKG